MADQKIGDVILELKTDSKDFNRGVDKAEKGAKELDKSLQNTSKSALALKTKLLGIGAAVVGVGFAIKKAFDFTEAGARLESQRRAFDNLAKTYNISGDSIIESLKEVSRQTVATSDLVIAANKAMLLGIDPARFVELMEIARAASKATGDTITKSFEDITIGIGRQSKLILDNLGIIVKIDEANKKYAATLGIEASKLTDTQKKQAFLNETLEAGRRIIEGVKIESEDAADKIAQLKTQFKEFSDFLKTFTLGVASDLVSFFQNLAGAIEQAGEAMAKYAPDLSMRNLASRGGQLPPSAPIIGGSRATLTKQPNLGRIGGDFKFLKDGAKDSESALVDLDKEINKKGIDLNDMANTGVKAFGTLENAVTGWASGFASSMTNALWNAENAFAGILDSFGRMITEMFIQTQFIQPIMQGLFGFSNAPVGGITGPPTPAQASGGLFSKLRSIIPFFDKGGVVPGAMGQPVPAVVHGGETVIPANKNMVEVNVYAPEGTSARTQEGRTTGGGRRIDVVFDEITAENIRPGTRTFSAMQKTFGNLNPTLTGR